MGRIHVLWRIEEIKKFVAFPRLTPLQPDAYAQSCKRASLSEPPHLSGLPGGRRKATKQNSCRWQYKKAPLEPQRYPSTGGEFPVLGMFLLSFYHGLNRQNELACGYWVQDKNIKKPLRQMHDVSCEPLMLRLSGNPSSKLGYFQAVASSPIRVIASIARR